MNSIEERIQNILEQLEQTNEDLLALSDDIWLSIDHNDNQALKEGIAFKEEYNERLAKSNELLESISKLVEDYTGLEPQKEESAEVNTEENERIIKSLDIGEKHFLSEDFKYKRPYGFTIQGKAFQNVRTWRKMYQLTLRYLYNHFTNFDTVLDDKNFTSNQGNKFFSINEDDLRKALKIANGFYAEVNLSANNIRDRIRKLLNHFEIDSKEFVIYLREDRDWES
jgi:hypothetical protein